LALVNLDQPVGTVCAAVSGGVVLGVPAALPTGWTLEGGQLLFRAADCSVRGSGVDLHGCYLAGANLSGADLSGADLSGAYLVQADLSGAEYFDRPSMRGLTVKGAPGHDAAKAAAGGNKL
jgi:hypothetical protein